MIRQTSKPTQVMGLVYNTGFWFLITRTDTFLIRPFWLKKHCSMTPFGHCALGTSMSFINTTSPSFRMGCSQFHLWRACSVVKYLSLHWFQNCSARACTWRHCDFIMSLTPNCGNDSTCWPVFWVRIVAGTGRLVNQDQRILPQGVLSSLLH